MVSNGLNMVGNKAKGRISKRVLKENQAHQVFQKTNISYSLIRTNKCGYQWVRKVCFLEKLACFCFLVTPILIFAISPYYRRHIVLKWHFVALFPSNLVFFRNLQQFCEILKKIHWNKGQFVSDWLKEFSLLHLSFFNFIVKLGKDGESVVDSRFQNMIDKTASDSYDLKIFSVDKYESFTLNLTCIDTTKPVKSITESVHWERLYYNSAIPMTQNTNTITFKLENDFIRMKVRCEALRNNKILFTREFLFTEKRRYEIVPFVTQSPSFEYHGGRLIHSDPAKFYIDGNNFIYFSVHFTDIGKRVFIFTILPVLFV